MSRRRVGALAAATALLALTAAPAAAQQEYPPEPSVADCAIETSTPVLGETIALNCVGFQPGTEVRLLLFSEVEVLDTSRVGEDGEASEPVRIPPDLPPGDHMLRVSGINAEGEEENVDIALTVQAPGPAEEAGGDTPVATTGMSSWPAALLGVGLLAAGGGAVFAARRRQASLDR
jgi:LPXTG-motif cell wall-anchored protein